MPLTPPGSPKPERNTEQTPPPRDPNTLFGHTPRLYRCEHNHIHLVDVVDGELIFLTLGQFPELTPFIMLASIIQDLNLSNQDEYTEDYSSEEDNVDEVTVQSTEKTATSSPLPAASTEEEQNVEEDQDDEKEDVLKAFRTISM
ncbi:hypothetical protein [Legionella quateirensis]|uniref:Dot/Icm T4SS effector n=1 Tax=Legionella quateirensis TaxID=45072 RepID=A0A378KUS6_9GAMM|nr:hypothetical protein [Legionella quateirensis]KTD48357.1 Dot/Icm T4SS effector [Legionella quateirensis]STY18313.1 Dot/Icm secretion system substrate [Legionella quateirensis]